MFTSITLTLKPANENKTGRIASDVRYSLTDPFSTTTKWENGQRQRKTRGTTQETEETKQAFVRLRIHVSAGG